MGIKTNRELYFTCFTLISILFLPLLAQSAPTPKPFNSDSVWVMRSDGAQSCDPKSGLPLAEGAEELKAAKIPVLDSKKGSDSQLHAQVCGVLKGTTNAYLIPKSRLSSAKKLGYTEVLLKP
jgi:hypothetical protein